MTKQRRNHLFLSLLLIISFLFLYSGPAKAYEITIRVALLMNQRAVNLQCPSGLKVIDASNLNKVTASPNKVIIKVYQNKLYANKKPSASSNVYVTTKDYHTPIYLNGVPYRGYFLIHLNSEGKMTVINHVGLEDYLGGVLGGEIIASWPMEAIKAQAVAARSYVLYKTKSNRDKLYDVVNNTADQMYVGVRGESSKFNKALRETRSQVLAKDGRIICAYYHSNSGGYTSDSDTVFYKGFQGLKGVKDPYAAGAPNSFWNTTISAETVRLRLAKHGVKTGKIFALEPLSRDRAGRIVNLRILHSEGETTVHGSDFRKYMGYREIKSTKMTVKPSGLKPYKYTYKRMIASNRGGYFMSGGKKVKVPQAAPQNQSKTETRRVPSSFYFTGQGWGHGVGMCQWGAKSMAQSGHSYKKILSHYYPGIALCVARSKETN